MVRGLDPHPRAERIADETEDVRRAIADFVGVGDGLQGNRAEADDQVVRTAGDLLRNGVGGPDVGLGVITPDLDATAIRVAASGQHAEESAGPLLESGQGSVLNQCHAEDFARLA